MNKRWTKFIILVLALWCIISMVAGYTALTRVKITLGEAGPVSKEIKVGMARYLLDKSGQLQLPISLTVPAAGCGTEQTYSLVLSATIHAYYNSDTGESFFRAEEISYSITITKDGAVVGIIGSTPAPSGN